MFFNLLLIIALFFSVLFLIVWYRTFKDFRFWRLIPKILKQHRDNKLLQKEHQKQLDAGNTAYYFENGKTVIYAKTQLGAIYEFRELKKKRKSEKK